MAKRKSDTVEEVLSVKDIRYGIIEMTDGRYVKILEIEPINLCSVRKTSNIIS